MLLYGSRVVERAGLFGDGDAELNNSIQERSWQPRPLMDVVNTTLKEREDSKQETRKN
jgi:hypothetical protein